MKHPDQYASIFWFFLGGAITGSSFYYGVGSLSEPGPGFITFLAGSALTLLSIALFISSGIGKGGYESLRSLWEGCRTGKVFHIMALLVIYMFLVTPVGFLLTTFAILALLFRVQGKYSMKRVISVAAVTTIVSFIVFDKWLGVQLPRGFMGYTFF
jgi:putative tricarboxylic transport membrane protein